MINKGEKRAAFAATGPPERLDAIFADAQAMLPHRAQDAFIATPRPFSQRDQCDARRASRHRGISVALDSVVESRRLTLGDFELSKDEKLVSFALGAKRLSCDVATTRARPSRPNHAPTAGCVDRLTRSGTRSCATTTSTSGRWLHERGIVRDAPNDRRFC